MKRHVLAPGALILPASLAHAHHEAASAATGEGVFLAVSVLVICIGVFIAQPRF